MDKKNPIISNAVFTVRADMDPVYGNRVARLCQVSGMTPAQFISGAVISFLKSMEKNYNITTRGPEVRTDETTTKKEGKEAQAGKERLASAQDKATKPKRPDGSKRPVGWPKGKPRGKRPKPNRPLTFMEKLKSGKWWGKRG
jgi:hypothetical protein